MCLGNHTIYVDGTNMYEHNIQWKSFKNRDICFEMYLIGSISFRIQDQFNFNVY